MMRVSNAMLAVTGLCAVCLIASCQSKQEQVADKKGEVIEEKKDVAEATQELAEATQELTEAQREARVEWQQDYLAFKREMHEEIAENERSILDLRTEVSKLDARYQDNYNVQINDVERQHNALRDRVDNAIDEGDTAWEQFKKNARDEFSAVRASIRNIKIEHS